jgi:hypothetical protein
MRRGKRQDVLNYPSNYEHLFDIYLEKKKCFLSFLTSDFFRSVFLFSGNRRWQRALTLC